MTDIKAMSSDIKTIGDLIAYLGAFDADLPATVSVEESAKTLIVVDSAGNATLHSIDRERYIMVMAQLPVTDA